jgi:integrase
MARVKLTAGRVSGFSTDKRQAFLWDNEMQRLAVRASAAGSKSYVFQSPLNGRDIRVTIGSVSAWGIDQAREEARRLQTLIDQGIDPREQKRERIAAGEAKREAARLQESPALEAWEAYIQARSPKWSPSHISDHATVSKVGGEKRTRGRRPGESELTQPGALRKLLIQPLARLEADAIRTWLEDESTRRPTHARLAFGLLRAFLNWCANQPKYREQIHADACASHVARNALPKKKAKVDALQREQLRPWFDAVTRIGNPVISAYLQTLLLTGARREELAALKWTDVDFQWKSMTIHDKVEGERTIPLTPYVAALLATLPRRSDKQGKPLPWVFSSATAASGHIQEPRIAHTKALALAGLPHISLHGLRRSFGTLAEWTETPVGIVAQIMGHKPSALAEKHYRRRPLDLLRMWHTKIEAWVLEQAGIDQPDETQAGLRLVKS